MTESDTRECSVHARKRLHPRLRRIANARAGLIGFLLLFGLFACWSLATPLFAAPDEPAHVIKALAVARGEFVGRQAIGRERAYTVVQVPATFADAYHIPACFAFHPQASAGCARPLVTRSGMVSITTYVGRYPPLYYLLVGAPARLTTAPYVLYLMRLVSGALAAAFLVAAFLSARLSRNARGLTLGLAMAVTPAVIFLGSVVNPSGLEIASATGVWVHALVLLAERHRLGEPQRRRVLVQLVLAAVVLVQLRGLSPVLLALILVTVLAIAGVGALPDLVRRRDFQIAVVLLVGSAIFAVSWILGVGSLSLTASGAPVGSRSSNADILWRALRMSVRELPQMVGEFGWNDTAAPHLVTWLWGLGIAVLIAGAVRRQWRARVPLLGLCVVVVVVPAILATVQAHRLGIVEQARYMLPLAVGIPVVAGYLGAPARTVRNTPVATTGIVVAMAQLVTFFHVLHRYRTGFGAPLFTIRAGWEPPVPTPVLIACCAAASVVLMGWWLPPRLSTSR